MGNQSIRNLVGWKSRGFKVDFGRQDSIVLASLFGMDEKNRANNYYRRVSADQLLFPLYGTAAAVSWLQFVLASLLDLECDHPVTLMAYRYERLGDVVFAPGDAGGYLFQVTNVWDVPAKELAILRIQATFGKDGEPVEQVSFTVGVPGRGNFGGETPVTDSSIPTPEGKPKSEGALGEISYLATFGGPLSVGVAWCGQLLTRGLGVYQGKLPRVQRFFVGRVKAPEEVRLSPPGHWQIWKDEDMLLARATLERNSDERFLDRALIQFG